MEKNRIYLFKCVLLAFVFSLSAASALAQTEVVFYHFLGGGSNTLWSNVDNWENGLKPGHDSIYSMVYISPVSLYPQNADIIMDEDVTIDYLNLSFFDDHHLVIQEGKTLTVNDTIDTNGRVIVVEDGAQLVTDVSVSAIVKKKIIAFGNDEKLWDIIASPIEEPIVPSIDNGLITEPENSYMLNMYVEETHNWLDFNETSFLIERGKGYLYINGMDTTLSFGGTLPGSLVTQFPLDYHSSNGSLAGCNLVGNPFACNAYTDRSYYNLDAFGVCFIPIPASSNTPVAPCTGMFVKAMEAGESVTFDRNMLTQDIHNHGYIEMVVDKNNSESAIRDIAIVSFNEGDNLGKLAYNQENPRLYFNQSSSDYAIISIDSVDVLPVRLKVTQNGSYTLKVTQKELSLSYLHLIDNITGSNIDLLTTPEYTFTSSTSDYASRFKLVFDPHYGIEEFEAINFAYFADGQIYIMDTQDFVSLQLIDLTGRVILRSDDAHTVSTTGMAPGIYLLRLNTGDRIMTQKIVIR